MPALEKANLRQLKAGTDEADDDTAIDVQFNPASLRLELANRVEGGNTRGQQTRQYLGKTSTVLSFDLYFDTADLGTTERPVSVRTKTAALERFVLPLEADNQKQAPPKARFSWAELVIDGVIESLSFDFEHFASDGTPLRAKVSVTMKEQDAKYELLKSGPGANKGGSETPPGQSGVGPGTIRAGFTDRTAVALGGESAAEFAVRVGLDPAAWRGVAAGLDSTLSLKAGLEIDFNASLSVGAGIGISAGVEAGASVSLEASLGLESSATAGVGAGAGADLSAGFALSAAGGVAAAIETAKITRAGTAAAAARQSFGPAAPPAAAGPAAAPAGTPARGAAVAAAGATAPASAQSAGAARPPPPEQPPPPLKTHGLPSPSAQAAAPPAPPPPLADPRSTSFGFGVPLRPRVGSAADVRAATFAGRIPLRAGTRPTDVLTSDDPTAAPWTHLPADRARQAADRVQRKRRPPRRCGCSGACSHTGVAS